MIPYHSVLLFRLFFHAISPTSVLYGVTSCRMMKIFTILIYKHTILNIYFSYTPDVRKNNKSNYEYVGIKCFKLIYISTCYIELIRTSIIGCTLYRGRERDSEREKKNHIEEFFGISTEGLIIDLIIFLLGN